VREKTGFAIGGVAPVGHIGSPRTFVERSLAAYPEIWAAAGHRTPSFRLSYLDLIRITGGARWTWRNCENCHSRSVQRLSQYRLDRRVTCAKQDQLDT
jgi:hypothetical protein